MVKKTVVLSQSNIDFVKEIAKKMRSKGAVFGDFSKALRKIIEEYKNGKRNENNNEKM